jgi:DNA-binding transcriptional LysR family regulator
LDSRRSARRNGVSDKAREPSGTKESAARGSKTRPDAWTQWLKTHPSAHRPTEIRYYDHHSLIVEAASAGLGVALSPLVLAVDDVERGSLAAPAGFDPDGSQYGLIWLGSSELQGVELELAEWLLAQFSCLSPNVL